MPSALTLPHRIATIFLCGDVMTGRGIDQILPHPAPPILHEPYVTDARRYVQLAEEANGAIARPAPFDYIWGEALEVLDRTAPDVRLVNLETAVTTSPHYWPDKGINYRMHPENTPALSAARIDVCALANNHVLDWGYAGLAETLSTLRKAGMATAGAGKNDTEARAPAIIELPGKGRLVVFAVGHESSGIPAGWATAKDRPGVALLSDLSAATLQALKAVVELTKRTGDIVVVSIHWGGNWGYAIPGAHRRFARALIDEAGVDLVHGHSSHHVVGIEVHRGKPIFYGCGDLLTDYEGIGGFEAFRGDLGLLYFVQMDPQRLALVGVRMVPTKMKNFRLHRASGAEARWLAATLNREGKKLGTSVAMERDGTLRLRWD